MRRDPLYLQERTCWLLVRFIYIVFPFYTSHDENNKKKDKTTRSSHSSLQVTAREIRNSTLAVTVCMAKALFVFRTFTLVSVDSYLKSLACALKRFQQTNTGQQCYIWNLELELRPDQIDQITRTVPAPLTYL